MSAASWTTSNVSVRFSPVLERAAATNSSASRSALSPANVAAVGLGGLRRFAPG